MIFRDIKNFSSFTALSSSRTSPHLHSKVPKWKLVRVQEDGTCRVLYTGTCESPGREVNGEKRRRQKPARYASGQSILIEKERRAAKRKQRHMPWTPTQ